MRKHDIKIEIAASPAEVWKAISTSEGIASWFASGTTVEPGAGGKITVSWGEGMEISQSIEVWEPEHRLRLVGDRNMVMDYTIEAREGTTVLRLVNSGFGDGADFDGEYDSSAIGWAVFFQILKHSAERGIDVCRSVTIMRMLSEPVTSAWEKLRPRVSPEFEQGITRLNDQRGHWCVEFPARGGQMVSLFCDSCGGATAITVMSMLYDKSAADADAESSRWTELLNQVFGQPAVA